VLRFKQNCTLSLIGASDTSVEFGGLQSSLMKNSGKKPTKKTSILKQDGASLGGLAIHYERMTKNPVKQL
jgi:hypothetical protein